jgi:DNA/RNA-binding domain of Phe-tRNA-synthetase-like protein
MITVEQRLYEKYPNVGFGILSIQGFETSNLSDFEAVKRAEIDRTRKQYAQYDRQAFVQTDPVQHYVRYYKQFKKTYHVLHQLESIVLKDKTIPDADPLVQVLFLAEVKHMMLIAGHDLDCTVGKLKMDLSRGGERYIGASGQEIELKENDIYLRDGDGAILSIIYGQDFRTRITQNTKNVMYLIEGVEGISDERMMATLAEMLRYLRVFNPSVEPSYMGIVRANNSKA